MEGVVSRRPAHAENSRCAALALPIPYGPSPSFLVYEPQQLTPVHQFFRALLLRRLYDHFDQTSDESCRSHLSSVWHELRGPTLQVQVFSKERKAPRLCNRESRPRGTWPVKSSPALERNHSLIYPIPRLCFPSAWVKSSQLVKCLGENWKGCVYTPNKV